MRSRRSLLHAARRFFRPTPFGGSAAAGSSKATSSPAFGRDRPKEVARIDVLYVDDSAVVPGVSSHVMERGSDGAAGGNDIPVSRSG